MKIFGGSKNELQLIKSLMNNGKQSGQSQTRPTNQSATNVNPGPGAKKFANR